VWYGERQWRDVVAGIVSHRADDGHKTKYKIFFFDLLFTFSPPHTTTTNHHRLVRSRAASNLDRIKTNPRNVDWGRVMCRYIPANVYQITPRGIQYSSTMYAYICTHISRARQLLNRKRGEGVGFKILPEFNWLFFSVYMYIYIYIFTFDDE